MTDLIDRAELLKEFYKVAREHHESHIPMVEHDFREVIYSVEPIYVRELSAHWCDAHGNNITQLRERLNEIPSADIEEILERSTICGYTFKELAVFADACKKKGITKKDMADFSRNVASVYEYVLEEVGRQFDAAIMKGLEPKHECK